MTEKNKANLIENQILEKIKSGQAKMRPQWYFVLKSVLTVVGLVFLGVAILYLVTFVIFSLRKSGIIFAPEFGWNGLRIFFISLPWLMIVLALIFIVILEMLVRRYSFAYRKPLLYSLFAIVVLVTAGGVIIVRSHLHDRLYEQAHNQTLPVAGPLYRGWLVPSNRSIQVGTIQEFNDYGFILLNQKGEIVEVFVRPQTSFPAGLDFETGDQVFILGSSTKNMMDAFGVRRVDRRVRPPRQNIHLWPR